MKMKLLVSAITTAMVISVVGCSFSNDGLDDISKEEIIVPQKKESVESLHELAKDDVPVAMGKLAKEFYDGVNLKRNDEKAFHWASKGHELKDEVSTFILARMYFYGEATKADPTKAIGLLESIKDKKPEVQYILGKMYLDQAKNEGSYVAKGVVEIMAAADKGLAQAQFDMANNLLLGQLGDGVEGVDKDAISEKSSEYLAMAAAQNYAPAVRQLGLYFYNGLGVSQNKEKGLGLLQEAVELGDSRATEILEKEQFLITGE